MKFSIIINSFNQAETLERTIKSVLRQRVSKEIILVDAGSTDGSIDIIEKYRGRIDKTIVNSTTDLGQSHAINVGFANSTGAIIGWINSDDWYEDDGLSRVLPYFVENSHPYTWLIASCNLFNESKKEVFLVKAIDHLDMGVVLEYGSLFWVPQQSTFWRRELFVAAGPLVVDDHVTMDVEMFLRFAALRKPLLSKEVVSNYAFHDKSKGSVFRKESFISQNKLRMRYAKLYVPFFREQGHRVENIPVHFRRALQSDLRRFVKHIRG